jgi:hypothetical protein
LGLIEPPLHRVATEDEGRLHRVARDDDRVHLGQLRLLEDYLKSGNQGVMTFPRKGRLRMRDVAAPAIPSSHRAAEAR